MQKYICNTCEHKFQQEPAANLVCPQCGSNNVSELQQSRSSGGGSFWDHGGYIISSFIILLMVVTLFLLPSMKPKAIALPPVDPCDCSKLRIISVDTTFNSRRAIVVHTNMPACGLEYSINGTKGPYQTDSIFKNVSSKNEVSVRNAKCPPKEYANNPVEFRFGGHGIAAVPEDKTNPHPYPPSVGDNREALVTYLQNKLHEAGIQGHLNITLVVETDGTITLASISVKPKQDQAAKDKIVRIIVDLGSWYSGVKDGSPVRTLVSIQL